MQFNFCCACGHAVDYRIPEDDDRPRAVCTNCEFIHYSNPRIIVGTLPVYQDKVLLCKRAIEPRKGYWTLPAGFMENGESTGDGAMRETWEEALAKVRLQGLYRLFDLPHINQVYMFYRAELSEPEFGAGPESLEVGLFDESEIPWHDLAFPVMGETLKDFFADRVRGYYEVRISAATPLRR